MAQIMLPWRHRLIISVPDACPSPKNSYLRKPHGMKIRERISKLLQTPVPFDTRGKCDRIIISTLQAVPKANTES